MSERIDVDKGELDALIAENAELRAMLGRDGKDSGRMWYDRAQRVKRERNEALAKVEQLRGRLRELEWANSDYCPACDSVIDTPHKPDCWLAKALAEQQE